MNTTLRHVCLLAMIVCFISLTARAHEVERHDHSEVNHTGAFHHDEDDHDSDNNLEVLADFGPVVVKSKSKGDAWQKSWKRPEGGQKIELKIQNGSGEDIVYDTCQGSRYQIAKCKVHNLLLKAYVRWDRPEHVQIEMNGQTLVSTETNLPREKGSITVYANLQDVNHLKAIVKGHSRSRITMWGHTQFHQNQLPLAQISYQGENGVAPETIQFSGLMSSDSDGQIVSYQWDFGDGQQATGSMVSHTYVTGGNYSVTLTVTDNQGGVGSQTVAIVIQSNLPPMARISLLSAASGVAPFSAWFDASGSTDPEGQALQYHWDFGDGETSTQIKPVHEYTTAGSFQATLVVTDIYGASSSASTQISVQDLVLPPDPIAAAPVLDPNQVATPAQKYGFLYSGSNPVQIGAQASAFDDSRLLSVSGNVIDDSGNPLSGVKVEILHHPEYGYTYTREDGKWDLAFNSGGLLVVGYQKKGYTLAERKIETQNQVQQNIADVILIKRDTKFSVVTLSTNTSGFMHSSSVNSDQDGSRKSSVFIPPNTQANIVKPDGTYVPVDQLTLRITEATVGADGQKRMPAELPPRTAYTWAADFSVDEAEALDSEHVVFNQPVPIYVDNFLNIPTGIAVPIGYLNPSTGNWEAMHDGVVVKVLGKNAQGQATLDLGSGSEATQAELDQLHFTSQELTSLASLYQSGDSFWRGLVTHFSFVDLNFNFANNQEPPLNNPEKDNPPPDCNGSACCRGSQTGCIINSQRRLLQESIPLPGTDATLEWNSERAPGRLAAGEIKWYLFNPVILQTNDLTPKNLTTWSRKIKERVWVEVRDIQRSKLLQNLERLRFYRAKESRRLRPVNS